MSYFLAAPSPPAHMKLNVKIMRGMNCEQNSHKIPDILGVRFNKVIRADHKLAFVLVASMKLHKHTQCKQNWKRQQLYEMCQESSSDSSLKS